MLVFAAAVIAIAFALARNAPLPAGVIRRARPVVVAPVIPPSVAAVPDAAPSDPLEALLPEDAEWVLDAVARAESVRTLSHEERRELVAQLASIRMHDVLERTEPLATGDAP